MGSARFKSLPTNSFVFYKEKAFGYCCFTHQSKTGGTHELEISDVPTPESGEYTNIIIVDELGNIVRPEEKNGKYYYNECPSNFVNLDPGQNLIIEREGDFVKITETGNT